MLLGTIQGCMGRFFQFKEIRACAFGTNWETFDEYKCNEVLS
jgi:hypothetical protein